MYPAFAILALFLCLGKAHAGDTVTNEASNSATIAEETDWGSALFEESLTGNGTFGAHGGVDAPWSWNLSYTYGRSSTPNPGYTNIIDITNTTQGGLGWTGESNWGLNLDLAFSKTAAEGLESRGGTLTFSRIWRKDEEEKQNKDAFSPSATGNLLLGSNTYTEAYSGTTVPRRKAVTRPVSGMVELQQFLIGLELLWNPSERWDFELSAKVFPYTHNVASFETNLDSTRALDAGLGNFAGTVGGLPKRTYLGDAKYHFSDRWTDEFELSTSVLAVGSTLDTTIKDLGTYQFAPHWQASAGVEYETSVSVTQWLGILGVGWIY